MTDKRDMLRHYLAAIAYRLQKALRDMPGSFPEFRAGSQTRSPHELVCHIRSVLGRLGAYFFHPPAPLVTTTCISRDGRSLTYGHTRAYFSYPPDGVAKQTVEETQNALRELGLDENIKEN
jgi:hypothetical protein